MATSVLRIGVLCPCAVGFMSLESDKRVLAANLTHPLLYKKICLALHSAPFESIDSSSQPSSLQRPSTHHLSQCTALQTSQPLIPSPSPHLILFQFRGCCTLGSVLLIVWNGFACRLVLFRFRRVPALTKVEARICRNIRKLFRELGLSYWKPDAFCVLTPMPSSSDGRWPPLAAVVMAHGVSPCWATRLEKRARG